MEISKYHSIIEVMSISKQIKRNQLPTGYWRNPIHFIACGFGTGASPYAPGTVGTLAGVLLYLPLSQLSLIPYLIVVVVGFGIGVWLCEVTSRDFGEQDHSGIVWDEVVGYWITMTAVPFDWGWVLMGFLLFRLFDVLKPWPIRRLDQSIKGGFGVMIDDVLAGIYAWLVLMFLVKFW